MTEFDETKPLSPALEGLQALMYQSDSTDGTLFDYIFCLNSNSHLKCFTNQLPPLSSISFTIDGKDRPICHIRKLLLIENLLLVANIVRPGVHYTEDTQVVG